ncbi:hypothetical protein KSS87_005762 [Heliosperma pusillum]|nr:hypothetical protein KSS87_005762 [Heliosperma pusillum]
MLMNTHNGEKKNFRLDEVLTKCHFREDYNPESKSLPDCNAIRVSFLVHIWNQENVEQPIFVRLILRGHTKGSRMVSAVDISLMLSLEKVSEERPTQFLWFSSLLRYLPVKETIMTLETESGDLYKVKYLPQRPGLGAGCMTFANGEKLVQGDLLVFHLVEATKFKVYITRRGSSTVKLPPILLNFYKKERQRALGKLDDSQLIVYSRRKVHQSEENSSKKNGNKTCKDTYQVDIDFSNIKGFKDFSTVINKLLENQHFSEPLMHDYYELCRSHNAFLHARLFKGLNPELFVGHIKSSISETVSIGIALRNCTLSTSLDKFSEWTKILSFYEAIGMNVSLLSARLDHLRNLAVNSDGAVNRRRYIEACRERIRSDSEVKKLEMVLVNWRKLYIKLASKVKVLESEAGWEKHMETYFSITEAKDAIREIEVLIADFAKFFEQYDAVIDTLKLKAINHEHQFQKEVGAPW